MALAHFWLHFRHFRLLSIYGKPINLIVCSVWFLPVHFEDHIYRLNTTIVYTIVFIRKSGLLIIFRIRHIDENNAFAKYRLDVIHTLDIIIKTIFQQSLKTILHVQESLKNCIQSLLKESFML